MTKDEKKKITNEVLLKVKRRIFYELKHDNIPDNWDGSELKQYCHELIEKEFTDWGFWYSLETHNMRRYHIQIKKHKLI
jgi:hypothetical protein